MIYLSFPKNQTSLLIGGQAPLMKSLTSTPQFGA